MTQTSDTRTDADPLETAWYAKPNDLIGGWCVMDTDQTPAEAQRPEIADFTTREHAEHIADLHNRHLAREHWHHAPEGSPYTRLKAYGEGDDALPRREDVMELLRAYNAADSMGRVHKNVTRRLQRRVAAVKALAGRGNPVSPQELREALDVGRERPTDPEGMRGRYALSATHVAMPVATARKPLAALDHEED